MKIFSTKQSALKILFVGSEVAPFVKVGGLGEVLYALPKALTELGHDVRTMTPKYSSIDEAEFPMEYVVEGIQIPNFGSSIGSICNVKKYSNGAVSTSYFLENQEYYEKRGSAKCKWPL